MSAAGRASVDVPACARMLGRDDAPYLSGAASSKDVAALIREFESTVPAAAREVAVQRRVLAHNTVGVRIDTRAAEDGASRAREAAQRAAREARGAYGLQPRTLRSDEELRAWIRCNIGVDLGSVSRRSASRSRAVYREPNLAPILAARDKLVSTVELDRTCTRFARHSGRVHPIVTCAGAVTGRATPNTTNGAGLNIHGLRRDAVEGVALRSMILPAFDGTEFVAADLSQVEARVLAHLAGDEELSGRFRRHEDPFAWFGNFVASHLDPELSRRIGKQATIGVAYGMSYAALCDAVQLHAPEVDDATVWRAYESLERAFPALARFRKRLWSEFEQAFEDDATREIGLIRIESRGDTVLVHLPSNRPLIYRAVLRSQRAFLTAHRLGATTAVEQETLGRDGIPRRVLTPSRLVENVTQALARDLLFAQLLEAEERGLSTAFTVHDEIVAAVERCRCLRLDGGHHDRCTWLQGLTTLADVMAQVPSCLPLLRDMPIACKPRKEVRRAYG